MPKEILLYIRQHDNSVKLWYFEIQFCHRYLGYVTVIKSWVLAVYL